MLTAEFGKQTNDFLRDTASDALETVLRIRPALSPGECSEGFLTVNSGTDVTIRHPTRVGHGEQFAFNTVVPLTTTQREMYAHSGAKMIRSALDGQNCCLFTYGASGSGKTHTMMGGPGEDAGVLARTMEKAIDNDDEYLVFASFVEIYNERIHDLLAPVNASTKRAELRIRQDTKGPFVGGVHQVQISSAQEAYKVIDAGRRNLNIAATRLNEESSRSHCLFVVKIAKRMTQHRWGVSQICFCDLAGKERSKNIGSDAKRLGESKTINKSLMQLGIVIEELRNNQKNPGSVAVSFRNSKLTRLMQSYLTGNSKTIIIVTVSQNERFAEETLNSLKFAASAKTVSLGRDRHGFKDTTKMNMSTIHDMTNASVMFKTMSGTMIDNYNVTFDEDYRKWKKIDLIDDLIYYRDRDRELSASIFAMKNAWKDDEKLMNEERMDFDIQKRNWKVDMHNQKARLQNEYTSETEKLFEKMKLLKQAVKEAEKQVVELRAEQASLISTAIEEALETKSADFERKLADAEERATQNDELLSEVQVLKMKNQNLEVAAREHKSKMEIKSADLRNARSAIAQLELKLASKEDELLLVKTDRMSIDPLDSNETIDFDKISPPTCRSSILPSRRAILNSTQELMLNIVDDKSSQSVSEENDKVDLYRQIQDLNRQLREAKKDAKDSSEKKENNHHEALLHQIKEAASREADQGSRINALELEIDLLKKRSDRCHIRKQKEALESENAALQRKVTKLENMLVESNDENMPGPPSTPSKKFKNSTEDLNPIIEHLGKSGPRVTRSQRRISDTTNQELPKRNLRSRK
ncbi:unnamed protein product [Oikopleura dioica]|uniref:Kinesin motor domain-containing protein n=1 Tax=Oikopleura dioica TaxID=34765 RepID=E4XCB1_OIKDI|nr:unnamed protein product [Oikopleura dioica]